MYLYGCAKGFFPGLEKAARPEIGHWPRWRLNLSLHWPLWESPFVHPLRGACPPKFPWLPESHPETRTFAPQLILRSDSLENSHGGLRPQCISRRNISRRQVASAWYGIGLILAGIIISAKLCLHLWNFNEIFERARKLYSTWLMNHTFLQIDWSHTMAAVADLKLKVSIKEKNERGQEVELVCKTIQFRPQVILHQRFIAYVESLN